MKAPGILSPAGVAAHKALSAALLRARGPLPCQRYGDPLSDVDEARLAAAEACPACAVLDACRAAGKFHKWGVWGGIDRGPTEGRARR